MLKEEDTKKVSEIAYICGFNDSNYFSDKFKRTYGISPLAFSKKNKEERKAKKH
jgi:AraC family L-rhamnose operon regulatory protein RhaS